MHIFNTLYTLALANIAAAAPATTPETHPQPEPRAENTNEPYWAVIGWGNPNCEGDFLWAHSGSASECRNGRVLAASYTWVVTQDTQFFARPAPTCGILDPQHLTADPSVLVNTIRFGTGGQQQTPAVVSGQAKYGCSNGPVYGYDVYLLPGPGR